MKVAEPAGSRRRSSTPRTRRSSTGPGHIYFADEAGIRSDYHSGTTWAPVGQTPIVTSTGRPPDIRSMAMGAARSDARRAVPGPNDAADEHRTGSADR